LTIGNDNTIFAQNGHLAAIGTPHYVFNFGCGDFSQDTTRLDFKQNSSIFGTQQNTTTGTTFEQGIDIGDGRLDPLGRFIVQILDNNLTLMTIENGKSIFSQENGRSQTGSSFAIRHTSRSIRQGKRNQFVRPAIDITANQNVAFGRIVLIVRQESRSTSNSIRLCLLSYSSKRCNGNIDTTASTLRSSIIVQEQFPAANIVQFVGWSLRRSGTFPFQFKDNHTRIMTGRQQILGTMGRQNPKAISFATKRLDADTFADIPNANTPIFRITHHQIVFGMKETATNIVGMPSEGIDFPCLCFTHSPQFDLPIISGTCKEGQGGMEASPIDTTIMSLQDVLDNNIIGSKEFRLDIHGSRIGGTSSGRHGVHHGGFTHLLFAKTGGIPNSDRLIQRSRNNQILGWMKGGTHDIVIVTRQDTQTGPFVEIP
jgi:hypothetical protein